MTTTHSSPRLVLLALFAATGARAFAVDALVTSDTTVFSGSTTAQGAATTFTVTSASTKSALVKFNISGMLPAGTTSDQVATARCGSL